ncbi:MAG: sel1 repeat family protein [Nitrospiraceae bacterium]|nr:MAG: sel1 repeat family protein [Nitrospiraceae bacterium]
MRAPLVIILLTAFVLPPLASAEVQTFTATHTYILGDHDSKDDARQRCLLETKRKILEQAGVYIESASEVKNFDLTKDKITSFAAAVMQVKDTKETVSFQQGHMTMTLKLKANVDLAEVRKQLAVRQVDAGVQGDVAAQEERLKRLEAQLEAMIRRQQSGQSSVFAPVFPPIDIPAEILQTWHTQAAQGHADEQSNLGWLYATGQGVPQDFAQARQWYEKAAAQGNAFAQESLGWLHYYGNGVPKDYAKAAQWFEEAAVQGIANAQGTLALMYQYGQGVPKNDAKARLWYEKAAAGGNADAQNYLGVRYDFGDGAPQDYVQAAKWYEKAAVQGYARAQNNLGALYANGHGVPQNDMWAYMWHNLAAAHSEGDLQKLSANNRGKVARRMSPAQIVEAQQLSQQCQAQGFKGCK